MFKGYLVDENGRYGEPIELDNPEFSSENENHKACKECYRNSGLPEMIEEMFKDGDD